MDTHSCSADTTAGRRRDAGGLATDKMLHALGAMVLAYMGDPYMMPPGSCRTACCTAAQLGGQRQTALNRATSRTLTHILRVFLQVPTTALTAARPCNRSPPSTAMKASTDTTTLGNLCQATENLQTSLEGAISGSRHRARWIQSPKMGASRSKSIIANAASAQDIDVTCSF